MNQKPSGFRTFRGYQLVNQQEGQLTSAMEDYLEMAYRLYLRDHYTRVGKLSELLHVKPSSVSKMISKLAELGYLEYNRHEIILMTEKGKEIGAYLLYRHERLEQFLHLMGNDDPLEETELIEHSLSPATLARLDTLLDFFSQDEEAAKRFDKFKRAKKTGSPYR